MNIQQDEPEEQGRDREDGPSKDVHGDPEARVGHTKTTTASSWR